MCVNSSLKVSSLKLCVCVCVCVCVCLCMHACAGRVQKRHQVKFRVFLTGPPALWSQDTCVPCLTSYFLCRWEFFQYMMDGCLGEWIDSKQSCYSLGLHTVTAGRCSYSSSFLQFSDPPNPLTISYLGGLGSQMDPHFCHRNNSVSSSALIGNCLNIPHLYMERRGRDSCQSEVATCQDNYLDWSQGHQRLCYHIRQWF